MWIKRAFYDLGLHRVYLYALASNEPALRIYERAGFEHEGLLREHVFKQGKFHDIVILGLKTDTAGGADHTLMGTSEGIPLK